MFVFLDMIYYSISLSCLTAGNLVKFLCTDCKSQWDPLTKSCVFGDWYQKVYLKYIELYILKYNIVPLTMCKNISSVHSIMV